MGVFVLEATVIVEGGGCSDISCAAIGYAFPDSHLVAFREEMFTEQELGLAY